MTNQRGRWPIKTARDERPRLILASASPRRRQLLEEAGYSFEVDASGVEEPAPDPRTSPASYATDLAWRKAGAVARRRHAGLILGADTVCAVSGQILNKPVDRDDAERMIRLQEGHDTEVISGICLYRAERDEWIGAVEVSVVRFKPLSERERDRLSRLPALGGQVGSLRCAGPGSFRLRRPRQLLERGGVANGTAGHIVTNLSSH